MIRILITTVLLLLGNLYNVVAQNTVEDKSKEIARKIDSITVAERKLMKLEIQKIEKEYNQDKITEDEFEMQKEDIVAKHAKNIKKEINILEDELHVVVQDRVNYKLSTDKKPGHSRFLEINIGKKEQTKTCVYENKRTYSYLVIAFGLNNVIKDADINSMQDMPYKFWQSRFFELGLNYKSRIFKANSIFYIDYGMSVRYHNLRVKNNLYFTSSGNTTALETFPYDLKKSRFKNVQLVAPVMLELDFSKPKMKDGKKMFYRNRAFRFGIGAFAGINLKTKQILKYKLDGKNIRDKRKGDYNVNKFVYGIQTVIGYKDTSFYAKYDINDLFYHNFSGQHNVSFGVRFDL